MRDVGFTIEERFILTAQELEYSEVGEEHESLIERAISMLYRKVRTKDLEFSDEERILLEDAFVIVSEQ